MSLSTKYATPLVLTPSFSTRFFLIVLTVYLLAILSLLVAPLEWQYRLLSILPLLYSFFHLYRYRLSPVMPSSIVRAVWQEEGAWQLDLQDGRRLDVELQPGSFFHPWLVILNFKEEGQWMQRSLVLFPDSLDRESYRRLRVRLKLVKGKLA